MLRLQKRILLAVALVLTTLSYYSCSDNDESFQIEDNQAVISASNFETLKSTALSTFQSKDFSAIFNPATNSEKVNYKGIAEKLNQAQYRNFILPADNYQNFKTELRAILGDDYHEAYFSQLFDLYQYAQGIAKSDLFNQKSSLEERQSYLQEALEHAFLYETQNSPQNRYGECEDEFGRCSSGADTNLGIATGICTATAAISGFFTFGIGAATWVPCMILAGNQWEIDMDKCNADYNTCTRYN